jgi:endonuclease YncB( thermonuclease family)
MRLALLGGLTLWAALAAAQGAPAWSLGSTMVSLVQAGYLPADRAQAWEAELELRFYNGDLRRRFNRNVTVQFQGGGGKGSTWKAFLSLPPGTAQHRRVRVPQRLRCQGALEACPPLTVRVFADKAAAAAQVPVPRQALQEPEAPPAGKPLWVAKVHDGDTLELLDGRKIRLLGVDAPERERGDGKPGSEPGYREAADFCRERVMNAPVTLAYDGEKRDVYGRWLAQVSLADGRDLNAELLRRGLAKTYQRSGAERLEAYKKIEAQAREQGLGLWKAP